jgi:P4 family phage/plasmid primase-like protien
MKNYQIPKGYLVSLLQRDSIHLVRATPNELCSPCPFCGGEDRFRVFLDGDKEKYWCRQCGAKGDVLQYFQDTRKTGLGDAVRHICGQGREYIPPHAATPEGASKARYTTNTKKFAYRLWESGKPIQGTVAEQYLASRHITDLSAYALESLRFAEKVKHPTDGEYYACLLACVQDAQGEFMGVQRIYLDGMGNKLSFLGAKLVLGELSGGFVLFSSLTENTIITEGIEDALSLCQYCKNVTIAAGLGANTANIILPRFVEKVILYSDGDEAGTAIGNKLSVRLRKEGKSVKLRRPPLPFKDFSEYAARNSECYASLVTSVYVREMLKVDLEMDGERVRTAAPYIDANEGDVLSKVALRFTDVGIAAEMAVYCKHKLRYCIEDKRWYVWDDKRWQVDNAMQVERFVRGAIERSTEDARQFVKLEISDSEKKKIADQAFRAYSGNAFTKIAALVRSTGDMPMSCSQFDCDRWLLNVKNGILDLRDGHVMKHSHSRFITKFTDIDYNPGVKCPLFIKFLNDIFCDDAELVSYVQKVLGYALTSETSEQKLFFLWGDGANGKSTFIQILEFIASDLAVRIPAAALMESALGPSATPDLVRLKGTRIAIVQESNKAARFDEAMVKTMVGDDMITARALYQEPISFAPTHKLFFASNHKPAVRGQDRGIWRRISLIPFNRSFEPSEMDQSLVKKLKMEKEGILAWMVEGCIRWQREGLGDTPIVVTSAVAEYRDENDEIAEFVLDYCFKDVGARTPSRDIYARYRRWCIENGEKEMSNRSFGKRLSARGYKPSQDRVDGKVLRMWNGIGLREFSGTSGGVGNS